MKYLQRSFTVKMGENEAFRSNYDRIFAKTPSEPVLSASEPVLPILTEPLPDPLERDEVVTIASQRTLISVTLHLPPDDYKILSAWAAAKDDQTASQPLDPDVAHTVLMAVADAVTGS